MATRKKQKQKTSPSSSRALASAWEFFSSENPSGVALGRHARVVLEALDRGEVFVVDPQTLALNVWVKRAILAYFGATPARALQAGVFEYWDKMAPKKRARLRGVRVVPGAIARYGSFVAEGAILMPAFVNVGAYVGPGSMIDTWATVGSCAFVGAGVHLSGGVGIGGVLEPAQATPVIIEDGAFIGSRCIVVEGVRIGREAVLGAGVTLTASTKIVDVRGQAPVVTTGRIPERAVVIPGMLPKTFAAGEYGVPCALIIGTRSVGTDRKTSLNAVLREHGVAV